MARLYGRGSALFPVTGSANQPKHWGHRGYRRITGRNGSVFVRYILAMEGYKG